MTFNQLLTFKLVIVQSWKTTIVIILTIYRIEKTLKYINNSILITFNQLL